MRLNELNFKHNIIYLSFLFVALSIELILQNMGVKASQMPNFVMCIVFSFAFIRPVPIWVVTISVIISESFFSTTPFLMASLILVLYFIIIKVLPRGDFNMQNVHFIVFMLIAMVAYSIKILWLYVTDQRLEVTLILIKMLVTIILFPLFYFLVKRISK